MAGTTGLEPATQQAIPHPKQFQREKGSSQHSERDDGNAPAQRPQSPAHLNRFPQILDADAPLEGIHWRNEPVSSPGQCLNKARVVGGVAQGFAQLVDCRVQAVVEINERVLRPYLRTQFFVSDDIARSLQQNYEYLKRLILQLDAFALLRSSPTPTSTSNVAKRRIFGGRVYRAISLLCVTASLVPPLTFLDNPVP